MERHFSVMEATVNESKRSLALDGVRGFAVLIVFLSHSSGRELYPAEFLKL